MHTQCVEIILFSLVTYFFTQLMVLCLHMRTVFQIYMKLCLLEGLVFFHNVNPSQIIDEVFLWKGCSPGLPRKIAILELRL